MKKKIVVVTLLMCLLTTTTISCNKGNTIIDSDYDGLTDDIDPDPHNNQYNYYLSKDKTGEGVLSKNNQIKIDYHNFTQTNHVYNHDAAKFAALCINEINFRPVFLNNVYPKTPTEQSKIFPLYAQIGCKDIVHIDFSSDQEVDPCDVAGVYIGHHTIEIDNQKHQVFFITIDPYPIRYCWYSNFDVGADTDGYYTSTGQHPEWSESSVKKYHKGYYVSAIRAKKVILEYEKAHKENDAKIHTFIAGHSRGGSISNIIAKLFNDEGRDVVAYCFNPPKVVSLNSGPIENYSNIYNINCKEDYVSTIPVPEWGNFTRYGKDYLFSFASDEGKARFKDYFSKDYEHCTKEAFTQIDALLAEFANSRENIYKLNAAKKVYSDDGYESEEEAKIAQQNLENSIKKLYFGNEVMKQISFGDIEWNEDDWSYYYTLTYRPSIISTMLLESIACQERGIDASETLEHVLKIFDLTGDFVTKTFETLLALITTDQLSSRGIIDPHIYYTSELGVDYVETN